MFLFISFCLPGQSVTASAKKVFTLKDDTGSEVAFLDDAGNLKLLGFIAPNQGDGIAISSYVKNLLAKNGLISALLLKTTGNDAGSLRIRDGFYEAGSAYPPSWADHFKIKKNSSTLLASLGDDGKLKIAGYLYPITPTGISARWDSTNTSVTVRWSDNTNGTAVYHVERSTSPDFSTDYHDFTSPNLTYYIDINPPAGQTYYYRVYGFRNVSGGLYSDKSEIRTATRSTLQTNITANAISPIFPTPSYFANLPQRYLTMNGGDGSKIAGLSALQLEALFVYRPNLTWDEGHDNDYKPDLFYSNYYSTYVSSGIVSNIGGYPIGATVITVANFTKTLANNSWVMIVGDSTLHVITAHQETGGRTTQITISPGLRSSVVNGVSITVTDVDQLHAIDDSSHYFGNKVNSISDWLKPTIDEDGGIYVGGDNSGAETGKAFFSRFQWEDIIDSHSYNLCWTEQWVNGSVVFSRIRNMAPGLSSNMLTSLNADRKKNIYGEVVAWHPFWRNRSKRYDPGSGNPTGVSENTILFDCDGSGRYGNGLRDDQQRCEMPMMPTGTLFIGGAFYDSYYFDNKQDFNWVDFPMYGNFFHVEKLKDFVPNIFKSLNNGGNWWDGEQGSTSISPENRRVKYFDSATSTFVPLYPAPYNPDYQTDISGFTSKHQWNYGKFTLPSFIQFGQGYMDYEGHEPDPNKLGTTLFSRSNLYSPGVQKTVYVYALSTFIHYYDQDALYLGRCQLRFFKNDGTDHAWSHWEYFKGVDLSNNPIWTSNIDEAKSALWSRGEMSNPSIMYEKNTDMFLMTTTTNRNSPEYNSLNGKFYMWVAKKPWGPWRKVYTSDYNGLQYVSAQDTRMQAGEIYSSTFLPNCVEYDRGSPEKLRVWLMCAGAWNRQIWDAITVPPSCIYSDSVDSWRTWDERFKGTYYAPTMIQVELKLDSSVNSDVSAVAQYVVPNLRMEGPYDHWALTPYKEHSSPTFKEAESLLVEAYSGQAASTNTDTTSSNHQRLDFNASINNYITFRLPNIAPGRYDINIRPKTGNDKGKYQVYVGDTAASMVSVGTEQNFYSASPGYPQLNLGSWITTTSTANKYLKFVCTAKDASSSSTRLSLDYIELALRPDFASAAGLGPIWVGSTFKTGPSPIRVSKLGRYYLSGNIKNHRLCLLDNQGQQVAQATVSMFTDAGSADKPRFDVSDKVDRNGFIYANIDGGSVNLTSNTTYHLLSKEGLPAWGDNDSDDGLDDLRFSAAEDCRTGLTSCTTYNGYIGFRFRTGPMGLRITHAMRMATGIQGDREFIIEKATTNPITDIISYNYLHLPQLPKDDPGTRILTINMNEATTKLIGNTLFAIKAITNPDTGYPKPIDLLPSTEYYIGTEIRVGDKFFGINPLDAIQVGSARYDEMPKVRFNSNVLQYIYPAAKSKDQGIIYPWKMANMYLRPLINNGEKYDDGLGVIPPVWGPVNFLCRVPDRFEGYRNPYNRQYDTSDSNITMPMFDTEKLSRDFQVLNCVFAPSAKPCGSNNNWSGVYEPYVWYMPCYYGGPNTCPGPLDFEYVDSTSTLHRIQDDTDYTSATGPKFSNTGSIWGAGTNRNRYYVRGMNKYTSGYSGVQIKVGAKPILIQRIGRYFSNSSTENHHVMIVNLHVGLTKIVAVGTIQAGGSGTWRYATMTHTDGSALSFDNDKLLPGHLYYLVSFEDYASSDPPFGAPDDFCTLQTGSSFAFLGAAQATDQNGSPINPHTLRMRGGDVSNPQGYGPLNMVYETLNSSNNPIDLALFSDTPQTTQTYPSSPWKGYYGVKLRTGSTPVLVTALGRFKVVGNNKQHRVILQRCAPAPLDQCNSSDSGQYNLTNVLSEAVASVVVDNTNGATGHYVYSSLEQPITLEPNTDYYLASYEDYTNGGESFLAGSGENNAAYNATAQAHFGYTLSGIAPNQVCPAIGDVWAVNENQGGVPTWAAVAGASFTANVNIKVK